MVNGTSTLGDSPDYLGSTGELDCSRLAYTVMVTLAMQVKKLDIDAAIKDDLE
jgi:hypothetical protein